MNDAEPKRADGDLRDELDDSWFDRPERRKIAAELLNRISSRRSLPSAAEQRGAARVSGAGLDDSWFK